jgi:hypothetical protein
VVDELRKIAGVNMADYVSVDGELDLAALTRDQTAALSEVPSKLAAKLAAEER